LQGGRKVRWLWCVCFFGDASVIVAECSCCCPIFDAIDVVDAVVSMIEVIVAVVITVFILIFEVATLEYYVLFRRHHFNASSSKQQPMNPKPQPQTPNPKPQPQPPNPSSSLQLFIAHVVQRGAHNQKPHKPP